LTTVSRKKGKWRIIRLLPHFEEEVTARNKPRPRDCVPHGAPPPDEERLSYDKEGILDLACSIDRGTPPDVAEALNEIAAQRRYQ
ncbi:hypothetical protein N9Z83_02980, partial [Akkermansiaceae bacterium]|nr:hypothetical protein [Akkermansiaceae bacterium]